jgi:hypothetical protein
MRFADTVSLQMLLRSKSQSEWHQLIYLQAALIGVMIFFAGQTNLYVTGCVAVFAFYTVSLVFGYAALRETYHGLRIVTRAIAIFPPSEDVGEVQGWMASRRYRHDLWVRTCLLGIVWAVVGGLLLVPLVIGRAIMP